MRDTRILVFAPFRLDLGAERLWRDARILAIGGGATEVMLDEAAKRY